MFRACFNCSTTTAISVNRTRVRRGMIVKGLYQIYRPLGPLSYFLSFFVAPYLSHSGHTSPVDAQDINIDMTNKIKLHIIKILQSFVYCCGTKHFSKSLPGLVLQVAFHLYLGNNRSISSTHPAIVFQERLYVLIAPNCFPEQQIHLSVSIKYCDSCCLSEMELISIILIILLAFELRYRR